MNIRVLLVEDNDSDARLTEEALKKASREKFECKRAIDLTSAFLFFKEEPLKFVVILLDLGLPESQGLGTLSTWFLKVGIHTPVVILSGLDDRDLMVKALTMGAQDYLTKDEIIPGILCRSLRYAVERHKTSEDYLHKAEKELAIARQKLVEVADSFHNIVFTPPISTESSRELDKENVSMKASSELELKKSLEEGQSLKESQEPF